MTASPIPAKFEVLKRELAAEHTEQARQMLAALEAGAETEDVPYLELFTLHLGVLEGTLEPGLALTKIVAVMRRDPNLGFARELYQTVSQLSYHSRRSSLAHSHPPPAEGDRHS